MADANKTVEQLAAEAKQMARLIEAAKQAALDSKSAELQQIKNIEAKQQFTARQVAAAEHLKAANRKQVVVTQELSSSGNHRIIVENDGQAHISPWAQAASLAKVEVDGVIYLGVSDLSDLPGVFIAQKVEHTTRKV